MKWIFSFFLLFLSVGIFAQTETTSFEDEVSEKDTSYWKTEGVTGLNFSQVWLENWSSGGDNSVAGNIYLNARLSYTKNHISWDNTIDTEFGQVYTTLNDWQKSADKLNLSSKFGWTKNQKLYYSTLLDFKTQYAKGYKTPGDSLYISNTIAPGYANLAIGIDYKPSPAFSKSRSVE